jgi:hypothetical protein
VRALQVISRDLKPFIFNDTTQEALTFLRPLVIWQARRSGERLAQAAAKQEPVQAVRVELLSYWRLASSSFILVGDDELIAAADEFAKALEAWEDAHRDPKPGGTPKAAAEAVQRGWSRLQKQCDHFPLK